jgi:hypothetical protein
MNNQRMPMRRRLRVFLRGFCLGMDPTLAFSSRTRRLVEMKFEGDWYAVGDDMRVALGQRKRETGGQGSMIVLPQA